MIVIQELRIGNYFYHSNDEIHKVCSIIEDGVNYDIDFQSIYMYDENKYENINPIPLNEEWLLKLGLLDIGNNKYRFNNFVIEFQNNMFILKFIAITGQLINLSKEIKYVHSLQNIVFALTNTELTIKE